MGARAGFVLALSQLALFACSFLDPSVGPNQAACSARSGSASSTGYGSAAADAAGTCGSDAGSACDDCESRWCCHTRNACYADPVCDCADEAMDTCMEMAAGEDAATGRCWSVFGESGDVAKSRLACLRAWCQGVCGLP
jgi:hypothetical protein